MEVWDISPLLGDFRKYPLIPIYHWQHLGILRGQGGGSLNLNSEWHGWGGGYLRSEF